MENRFLELDRQLRQRPTTRARRHGIVATGLSSTPAWATPFAAADRTLVVLIENKGVDLQLREFVDALLAAIPGGSAVPEAARSALAQSLRDVIRRLTDNLLETAELTLNRYSAAKPDLFGDVVLLRDGTASYADLKRQLISLAAAGKIVDVFVLTHGNTNYIAVEGGVDGDKIRAIKTEYGKPLSLRSVYMMNCVGSTLNQAWLDAGARVSSGAIRNNYLPEPTMYFFWENWKAGQGFEAAVTGAYRKTIKIMNDTVRGLLAALPIPGASVIAAAVDFAALDFVRDSAPVIQGQRSVTITTDDLAPAPSTASSLATTVLPVALLQSLSEAPAPTAARTPGTVSPQGLEFVKQWETFRPQPSDDAAGRCAIGYGTVLHAGSCDGRMEEQPWAAGVSEARALELLGRQAAEVQQAVNDSVTVPLNQNQNDALVSFAANVGADKFRGSTLLRKLNERDYAAVPLELRKWTKVRRNGEVAELPALATRRSAEADLFGRAPEPAAAQSMSVLGRTFSAVNHAVPGLIVPLAQRSPNVCWATVSTMMWSWLHQQSIDPEALVAKAGPQWVKMYKDDRVLDAASAAAFYGSLGFETMTSQNPSIEMWESLLRHYGPLDVDIGYGTSPTTHGVMVTGIAGDGTADGTSITYVDPDGGKVVVRKFSAFLADYEAPGAVENWPLVIVHWPASAQASAPNASVAQSVASYALTDSSSTQSEQSVEVRRRVARSVGLAEAGGRFDLVHDDSNRVNFGLGSWTGSRIADVLGTYEQYAGETNATATLYGYFGGQAAFDALRQRFRTHGTNATASTAERDALRRLGADTSLQEAQIRHLANDVKADLDSIGGMSSPSYPFTDGGMGAISELAAHVLVHAKHQAGGLSGVLNGAIAHFGGEAALGQAMVAGTVTEQKFLGQIGEEIVGRVKPNLQVGVRARYQRLLADHGGSGLAYYFSPAN